MGLYTHVYAVFFCVIGNFAPITHKRSEKNEQRELEIPGGYFGRNVVIYVRMRTK